MTYVENSYRNEELGVTFRQVSREGNGALRMSALSVPETAKDSGISKPDYAIREFGVQPEPASLDIRKIKKGPSDWP